MATQNGGNTQFSAWVPALTSTAQVGEPIYGVRLECSGYSCLITDDNDGIDIRYYGRRPDAISLGGAALPLCRTQTYPVSVTPVLGAYAYGWSATNGATVTGSTGTSATLDLSGVPAGTTSVTLRVAAFDNNGCPTNNPVPGYSATRDLVVPITASPAAPANLQIDGVCPSTLAKMVSIDAVPPPAGQSGGMDYHWYLSGSIPAGTHLIDPLGNPTQDSPFGNGNNTVIRLVTPTAGNITVNVEAKMANSNCGGAGPALSRTIQIDNITPVCPTLTANRLACSYTNANLNFNGTPGASYYIQNQPYNIVPAGATATIGNGASPTATTRPLTVDSGGRYEFDVDVLATSPCPGSGPGFTTCTIHVFMQKFISNGMCRTAGATGQAALSEAAVRLYPNPTTGRVSVQPAVPTRYQWVKVLNLQGRVVLDQQTTAAEGITAFDVQALPMGLYEVQLFDGKKLTTQRLQRE